MRAARTIIAVAVLALALASSAAFAGPAPAQRASDRELARALEDIVQTSALRGARTSILVEHVESGELVYAHDADALLNPASNVKLFTTAAALGRLGPEFRFETEVWADAPPSSAGARALYVRGKGDPSLVTERLWAVAGEIRHAGVRSVREIVVDETWFDGEREGPGYDQEQGDRSYLAPSGAASLNFNSIAIHVAPGDRTGTRARVEVEPESDFVEIENRATTGKPLGRRKIRITSFLAGGKQHVRVEGKVPAGSRPQVVWRRIDDPPAYLGHTLRRLLDLRGVKVSGPVRVGAVPASARLVHVAESEPLGDLTRRLNKHSNNFTAEQILKALGANVKGAPGSWPKGVAAVEDFLAEAGVPRGAYVMKNGSGLNDSNRFSARQHVTLLREMWRRFPVMADFLASLPVAGRDGTIRRRMGGSRAEGMLRAKTGTLEHVTSLCGYVETAAHERLAFAILVNDFPSRHGVVRAIDALGGALASAGRSADVGAAVASAVAPPAVEEPAAELRAQVATYYRLAEAGDHQNVPALRAALGGEQDPVLRMTAAEAIYLSDPAAEPARRAFLENLSLDEGSLARLRAASAGLRVESPVLGSLADLAAEGNGEAALRLVEAAPAARREPAAAAAYEKVLGELAAEAPDPLLGALRRSPAAAYDAALDALARTIAAGEGAAAAHPFPAAVERAAGATEPEAAAFARGLAGKLAERIAAERALRHPAPADAIGPATAPR